ERQAELVEVYVRDGGRVVVAGELGTNLGDRMEAFLERPDVTITDAFGFDVELLPNGRQVEVVEGTTDAALTLQRVDGGCALHLIRYDYDKADDRVPPLERLVLDVRVPFDPGPVRAFSPDRTLAVHAEPGPDGAVRLTLRQVPL